MKFVCLIVFFLCPKVTFANDGFAAIGAGGIVFKRSHYIDMQSELLTISETNVNVQYEFQNRRGVAEEQKTETASIAFPLPEISCGYWGQEKIPLDFTVSVDGKKVNYHTSVRAFSGEVDVTDKIQKAGLPVDCRELTKNEKLFKKAQKLKWADDYKGTDPEDVRYKTRIAFYWDQEFPANKIVRIEHSYRPVLGRDSGSPNWFFNKAPHWDRNPSGIKSGSSLNYILMTAKTWSMGGVTKFKLVLKRKDPETFLGSTLGPLKEIDKNTFEFEASNFAPDRDLSVFFGNSK